MKPVHLAWTKWRCLGNWIFRPDAQERNMGSKSLKCENHQCVYNCRSHENRWKGSRRNTIQQEKRKGLGWNPKKPQDIKEWKNKRGRKKIRRTLCNRRKKDGISKRGNNSVKPWRTWRVFQIGQYGGCWWPWKQQLDWSGKGENRL